MNGRRPTPLLILALAAALIAADLSPLPWAGTASPVTAESDFPFGAVVGLQGTPHLWIADEEGILHWGGDTRALRTRFVDWSTRIEVSLDTLKTLTRGDPYLTAGLLKDGEPIYLVKWETEEVVPRLLHIQCIPDVELFGIQTDNYLRFVIDRPDWEARTWEGMRLQASSLQKLELPGAAVCGTPTPTPRPGATATATTQPTKPRIPISAAEIASCPWQRYGLSASDANIARTLTVAIPPSVTQMVAQDPNSPPSSQPPPIVEQLAPLVRPPTANQIELQNPTRPIAVGVARFGRPVSVDGASLNAGSYIVVIRGVPTPQVAFASCSTGAEIATTAQPTFRTLTTRNVSPPQALITTGGMCYSWNRVQVCLPPAPSALMTGAEAGAMNAVLSDTVSDLVQAGRLSSFSDINTGIVLPDLEGAEGVRTSRGSMLAAPATSWPGSSANNAVAGVLKVDVDVAGIPGVPTVPAGEYVVRVSGSTFSGWTATLTEVSGRQMQLPVVSQQVLGSVTSPEVAIVNLAFVLSDDVQLCFFGECGP